MEIPETPSDAEIKELRRKVFEHPTDLQLRFDFGFALFRCQKYSEAIGELQKAQQWPANRRKAQRLLADAYDAKGMHEFAARVRQQLSKDSGEDGGEGSAPVHAPKRPITPLDSFGAERLPNEDDRAT